MGRLAGKIVLITGSARGQGEAEARLFAAEGATVVVTDIDHEDGAAVAKSLPGGAVYRPLDVTDREQWDDLAHYIDETFGVLDVLVNNAGIAPATGRFDLLPVENHHRLFDVHVHGVFYGMRSMVALLERSRAASIINISSIDGLVGIGGLTSYTASKFAVTGMTRSAAIDLGPLGIRVNSIHPGVIDSPMVRHIQGKGRERLDNTVRRQPFPRPGEPSEIAYLALFLASDESSYCTGGQFTADGGHLAGPYRDPYQE
ncbi:3-alpha-hydroxysteroid dehydrogenase [Nocardia nova]|uniref:3-alpha-hydroxysteroid dehydrogenase n=1 Tax=Nocardia nova TaxID=37330 RepID=A0A2S6AN47_9NOCA|nr:SDR family oxidoreductase [Nocardia nova]PPJ25755.1 3-alpha-hydroxysteroid dehydrogenase [Nocardia nova]PPJ36616.1 3-alpha-hydroxysteroid dehydrogenase [Nocardia nova]